MSRTTFRALIGLGMFVLATYAVVSLAQPRGSQALSTFGNLVLCTVPLLANAGLLLNAGTPHWRRNIFWMLLALGCTLWMIGQFERTYFEVYLQKLTPPFYSGDIVFFFRGIPFMAALVLQPHRKRGEVQLGYGYLDFILLLTWWTLLYIFMVFPWVYATPLEAQYIYNYDLISNVQNAVILAGFGALWFRSAGAWRVVYANLFGASALYMLSFLTINVNNELHRYHTGALLDVPLVASFLWLGLAGVLAYSKRAETDAPTHRDDADESGAAEGVWAARLAMAAVISLPVFAIYTLRYSQDSPEVRGFRLMTILIGSVPLALLVFLRTHIADTEHARLLARSEESVENLQRLQSQLVQTEKLVSLGQLAAGAAHEINNPLTAILGFSDLLADDLTLPEKARGLAGKIREQARRTKTLVTNLLSFARQVPAERTLLDINTVVANAVQLRTLDLRSSPSRIETQLAPVLPGVRGDGNQLMQVFFNIIKNAIDAMDEARGGVLTIKTLRDRANVVVLLSDTGPGIKEPQRVFDPFYTTKPVGKGTGLGLSICFGIVQEHDGRILCYNSQTGGAVFRVELPAVLAALPPKEAQVTASAADPQKTTV